jgi:hypothetical protein
MRREHSGRLKPRVMRITTRREIQTLTWVI